MENFWYILVILLVCGILLRIINNIKATLPGKKLQHNFKKLTADTNGIIEGKQLKEVEGICGVPNVITKLDNGQTLCFWHAAGYHIALIFNEKDVCIGINSEMKI